MYTATALLGAAFLSDLGHKRHWVAVLLLAAVVGANSYGVVRAKIARPEPDLAALASWLVIEGETHGFSDYVGAYVTLFYSMEEVVVSPTIFDAIHDRRPTYTEEVRASERPFFALDGPQFAKQIAAVMARLDELGVDYEKVETGEMVVFRRLSRKVLPEGLGLRR